MALTTRRLTYEDLELIPQEREGDRHELIDGELFVTPAPVLRHQIISARLFRYLDRYVEGESLGMVLATPGIRLALDILAIPDICFVAREREPDPDAKTLEAPPELIVEILSPSTRRRDLGMKRALYARFRVPEYWIVDSDARSVTVLTLASDDYEALPLGDGGEIRSRILPGLALTLEQIFANLR